MTLRKPGVSRRGGGQGLKGEEEKEREKLTYFKGKKDHHQHFQRKRGRVTKRGKKRKKRAMSNAGVKKERWCVPHWDGQGEKEKRGQPAGPKETNQSSTVKRKEKERDPPISEKEKGKRKKATFRCKEKKGRGGGFPLSSEEEKRWSETLRKKRGKKKKRNERFFSLFEDEEKRNAFSPAKEKKRRDHRRGGKGRKGEENQGPA